MHEFDFCIHLTEGWITAAMIAGRVLAYLFCGFITIGIAGRWDAGWVTLEGVASPAHPVLGIIIWPAILFVLAFMVLWVVLWAVFGRMSRWIAGVK